MSWRAFPAAGSSPGRSGKARSSISRRDELREGIRWLDTAAEDLQAARALLAANLNAHACFAAQQCAEKAVKGLRYSSGEDAWGHDALDAITRAEWFLDQCRAIHATLLEELKDLDAADDATGQGGSD